MPYRPAISKELKLPGKSWNHVIKGVLSTASLLIIIGSVTAQDYTFDIPDLNTSSGLSLSGHLDGRIKGLGLNSDSPLRLVQMSDAGSGNIQSQWLSELYLDGDYQTDKIALHIGTYSRYETPTTSTFSVFELYNRFSLGQRFNLAFGKQTSNWGKGYAYNPAGFINPPKDPENPELAREGQMLLKLGYVQSFSRPAFQTVDMELVLLPPTTLLNDRYVDPAEIAIASKFYVLSMDTDLELYQYFHHSGDQRLGVGFSRNIGPSIEVHGEYAKYDEKSSYSFSSASIQQTNKAGSEFLVGLRFINTRLTTTILEYYHSDFGYSSSDIGKFSDNLENAILSQDPVILQTARALAQSFFFTKNIGQDYLYAKFSQPEPFDILYLTPSLQGIINLNDRSLLLSPIISYKPYVNSEFILWSTVFLGDSDSEYGIKSADWSLELWLRIYF
ncbi:MAG: hypothetical protein KAU50_04625 [Candidatus Marinimicrobia bacterium]|nr:hypothetical protein [Candidatus Neomarinimicrobiota bacterium]